MKERRVINIPKKEFDYIKKYCEDNALNMSKWIVKTLTRKINVKLNIQQPEEKEEL